MKRWLLLCLLSTPVLALSPQAEEFMAISKELEPVQCEKRKLRREIALAQAESRDPGPLQARFARLNRDPKTAKLEKRLAELEPQLKNSKDAEDLAAVSRQRTEAFYRCD